MAPLWAGARETTIGGPKRLDYRVQTMTRPRVLLKPGEVRGDEIVVEGERAHYLVRVLRLGAGDTFVAADPGGLELEAEIVEVGEGWVRARWLVSRQARGEPAHTIHVALGVLKGRAMEWAVQKLTEVGASALLPVLAERGVVRLDDRRWPRRLERWREIAAQAVRQCGRSRPPEMGLPVSVPDLADLCRAGAMPWLLLDPRAEGARGLSTVLDSAGAAGLIIGPEGDFTQAEKALLLSAGAVPVSLGPRVLRAETAAVVACALALHTLGDLG